MKKTLNSALIILLFIILISGVVKAELEFDIQGQAELDFGELAPGDYRPRVEPGDGITVRTRDKDIHHRHDDPVPFEIYFEDDVVLTRVNGGSDTLKIYEFITDLEGNTGELNSKWTDINVGAVLESIPYSIRGGEYTGQATVVIELLD